eukprot:jgi/Galph1/925/GphlegSOOS_G5696.1
MAVVRISGSNVLNLLQLLTQNKSVHPTPRHLTRVRLVDPISGLQLDDAMVVYFSAPNSYTGEDMAELYLHGSPAIVTCVLNALQNTQLGRLAESGEFTRRAFKNGKMDLVKVEAVADLIHSETTLQIQQALKNLNGALSQRLTEWRTEMMSCLAHLEALLDYGEEAELPDTIFERTLRPCEEIRKEILRTLASKHIGEMVREGVKVAIIGAPNAGKSSLLNVLAVPLILNGVKVICSDTAGIRKGSEIDLVEKEGIRRALQRARDADIRILVHDVSNESLYPQEDMTDLMDANSLLVLNKWDLVQDIRNDKNGSTNERQTIPLCILPKKDIPVVKISCLSREGIPMLIDELSSIVSKLVEDAQRVQETSMELLITREHHRSCLKEAAEALERFGSYGIHTETLVLAVEELRLAVNAIGRITGHVETEELLDIIFRDFCIGK